MRTYSHEGRVFISHDTAIQLSMTINAIAMSKDSIALFDGIREGRLTVRAVSELVKGLEAAAKRQREDAIRRAEAEAQADAEAYPGRGTAGSGAADRIKQ